MLDEDTLRVAGWDPIPFTAQIARIYGYPAGTVAYRKMVEDGALVAVVGHDDNGHAFALTHVTHFDLERITPGRLPTFVEVYAARRVLIPAEALMVALLEPMTFALKLRWERVRSGDPFPLTPGLPTTIKCVQMFVEAVTDDVVFGTEDVPNPTPGWPTVQPVPPPDPVGPVPDELLGDVEAALEDDDEDSGNPPRDGEW